MSQIIEKDGQKYVVVKGMAIPFSETDASGKPVIKVDSETITHPDGRKDVKIKVPTLKVAGNNKLTQ